MKTASILLGIGLAACICCTFVKAAEDPFYPEPKDKEAEYGLSATSQPHGIFYPGESASITLAVPTEPKASVAGGSIELHSVHTRLQTPGEVGFYSDFGKSRAGRLPLVRVPLDLTTAKDGRLTVAVPLPEVFGTYAAILVRADGSQTMLGHLLRVLKPTPRLGEIPQMMSGTDWHIGVPSLQERLGVTLLRTELHWGQDEQAERDIPGYAKHGIKVMVTTGIHPENTIPFRLGSVCSPELDAEFGAWVQAFVTKYYTGGKAGLWGIENFNEPWEPNGISGWGSDSLRYRDVQKIIYTAAKRANKDIPILAASSIMNTEDKFLSEGDGSPMMQYVDILTDHYVQPKAAYGGRMAQKWKKLTGETETWGGGSEVLLHQFMFQFLAAGNSFISPVQLQHFATSYWSEKKTEGGRTGDERFYTANTVGVAMATWNALIQERVFAGVAFTDHLPFLFQFGADQDAQIVMTGRLMALQTARARDVVWPQHAFAPDGTIAIKDPQRVIEARDCAGNPLPREADGGYILQLSPTPVFLRSASAKTVIEAVRAGTMTGLRNVEILPGTLPFVPSEAKPAPLTVKLHNLRNVPVEGTLTVASLAQEKPFSVSRPVSIATGATVAVEVPIALSYQGGLPLRFTVVIGGTTETWDEVVPCTGVARSAITGIDDPAWSRVPSVVIMRADGAAAGNEIDKIWKPFLFTDTKQDKLPAKRADLQLAWDDTGLTIRGSLEADSLGRRPRLETRNDDDFFYGKKDDALLLKMEPWKDLFLPYQRRSEEPAKFDEASKEPAWPAFIAFIEADPTAMEFVKNGLAERFHKERAKRPDASLEEARHVYRPGRDFLSELPFNGDSFQVAIDVDPASERFQRLHDLPQFPWSLPDGFTAVPDTDYEFSAYLCNDDKPELWCLLAPGIPRNHYFPRHTRGPVGQSAIKDGAVEVKRIGDRNVYFMKLTWARLGFATPPKPGQDFALTCRWNAAGGVEFGADYAATKSNGLTLHPYWHAMPSNTVRWTLLP